MPYDTYCWGEAQAASGYVATAAVAPLPIQTSGDTCTVRSGLGEPTLVGGGATSDTKCGGGKVVPSRSESGEAIILPGLQAGWFFINGLNIPLQAGETLTGYVDNANTNEGSVLGADIVYTAPHDYPASPFQAAARAGGGRMHIPPFSITSSAAVTSNSGVVAMDTATTEDRWLDTAKTYYILGVTPSIGAATFGGIMQVSGLPDPWNGHVPGIAVANLSAVTFDNRATWCPAYEPIGPFKGDALPSIGMLATSAGALTGGLVILETG